MPDFKGANGSSRITANVIVSNATRSGDDYGHGTHVAGILAGNSFNRDVSDPSYGDYVGIAPEANVVALKVADDDGDATMVDVITALQYVVHHKDQLGIGVVNVLDELGHARVLPRRPDRRGRRVRLALRGRRRRRRGQPRRCSRRSRLSAGQRPVRDLRRRHRRGRHARPQRRRHRGFLESRHDPGRRRQAGGARPGRSHRGAIVVGQRVPDAVPLVRRRRQLLPYQRHVDGGAGRRGRRGAAAPSSPRSQPRSGQGAADGEHQRGPHGSRSRHRRELRGPGGHHGDDLGPSTINGNLGLSPGTSVTGFAPGTVNGTSYVAEAIALKAQSDLTTAYNDAVARTPPVRRPRTSAGARSLRACTRTRRHSESPGRSRSTPRATRTPSSSSRPARR